MIKKIVLIGAGGFGREVAHMIERINEIEKNTTYLDFWMTEKNLTKKR